MSGVLLVIVFVGFAQTLFLRDYFGAVDKLGGRELPAHVQLHGALLASWFLLFLVQTSLAASRRTDLHRRLGAAGVVLAALIVPASVWTLILSVPRDALSVVDPVVSLQRQVANVTTLIVFAACVSRAVYLRRQPDAHKRLMLVASISVTGQAATRIAPLVALPEVVLAGVTLLGLLLALVVYDLVSQKRVHAATTWGVAVFVLCGAVGAVVRRSGIARAVIDALN